MVWGIHGLQNCCIGLVVSCSKRWAFQSNYKFKGILLDFALGVCLVSNLAKLTRNL